MVGIAYSYLRFSSPKQAWGDSRRRQSELAISYAKTHSLVLDDRLSFKDLGTSAFHGKNARDGALRAFLDAVEHGLVPAGSHLLVESLDRLSRERIMAAQALFLQIIAAGVTIVTLLDGRAYSLDSLNANPTDLIISLVYMMRANEESVTKSIRVRAALQAKRDSYPAQPISTRCPGWLEYDRPTKTFRIIEERADVVRRIYREVLSGVSHKRLVTTLNAEQVPLFGYGTQRGKMWIASFIRYLLRTPLVIGTFTPCTTEHVDGVVRVHPLKPIQNYYPAIIDKTDWERAQERRRAWIEKYKCQGRSPKVDNVLARLSRCPMCDRPMIMVRSDNPNHRYLACLRWREMRQCSGRWVRYAGIEDAFATDIRFTLEGCPRPKLDGEARRLRLKYIRTRLRDLRARQKQLQNDWGRLREMSRPVQNAAAAAASEVEKLLSERYRLRLDRDYWMDATLDLRLAEVRVAAAIVPLDKGRLNAALRAVLAKVIIDYEQGYLVLHWLHGGESRVKANMDRLRATESRRPGY